MNMKFWKRNWKMAAAIFGLTVAGLFYGFVERGEELGSGGAEVLAIPAAETEVTAAVEAGDFDSGATGVRETGVEDVQAVQPESMASPKTCFVHVCGAVRRPGVYELPAGSRIFEAVELAGGLTEDAKETCINLAQTVTDGMQIAILSADEMAAQAAASEAAVSGLVNLNTAPKDQLMTLPGIGASRAGDIIRYREESGGFQKIEDIMNISGIKDAAFQKIKDQITV